jgi:hypothetical protein
LLASQSGNTFRFAGKTCDCPDHLLYELDSCIAWARILHLIYVCRIAHHPAQLRRLQSNREIFQHHDQVFLVTLLNNLLFLSIYLIFTALMAVPVGILENALELTTTTIDLDSPWTIVVLALKTFNTILGFILYTIPTVAMALMYYSIRETSSKATIMERIRAIGTEKKKTPEYQLGDEQY